MWWGVLYQAAHDLRWGHTSIALDALEFLRDTGEWVAEAFWAIPPEDYRAEIVELLLRRNRERGTPLPIERLRSSS